MISDLYKSLLRSTTDLIAEIKVTTGNQDIAYHSWESRSDEDKLPTKTLIGIDGFSFEENQGLWVIRYAIGLSSFRDFNLLDEIDMIDIIHARTGEGKKIALLNSTTGDELTEMSVAAWQMLPMSQSELRNYRTIGIELLRTSNHTDS